MLHLFLSSIFIFLLTYFHFQELRCLVSSSPVFLHLTVADSVQWLHAHRVCYKVESKAFRLIDYPLFTDYLQPLHSTSKLHLLLSSTVIFMLTTLLNLLTACLPPFCSLAAHDFPLTIIPILSTSLMQELTSIFNLSSLNLVNSETLYLNLYFHLPTT